jgi:transposase
MTASLSPREFDCIYSFLKLHPKVYSGSRKSCRRFMNAVMWILRSGAQWRLLPRTLGKWNTVHKRFQRWAKKGIFEQLLFHLSEEGADTEWLCVDSTVVRAHMCAAGASENSGGQQEQHLGRSRGGFTSKLHFQTDAHGNPMKVLLTAGQKHDAPLFFELFDEEIQGVQAVLADKGYDSQAIRLRIQTLGAQPVIPSRKNSLSPVGYDRELYKHRHVVECSINKLKWFRRVFTRFDKLANCYLAFVCFACSLLWLR